MKINIFFFSKWKWKADALIQTLYKRAPGRDKRKEIPLPLRHTTLFFCHLSSSSIAENRVVLSETMWWGQARWKGGESSGEKKQKRQWGGWARGERKVHGGIILYFGPSTLPTTAAQYHHHFCPSARRPPYTAAEPVAAIHRTTRWQSTDIKKNKRKWRVSNARRRRGGCTAGR